MDQQFWLYLYGMLVSTLVYLASTTQPAQDHLDQLFTVSSSVQTFLVLGVLFSSVGGLVVAVVLKKLDNVAKEYRDCSLILLNYAIPTLFIIAVNENTVKHWLNYANKCV